MNWVKRNAKNANNEFEVLTLNQNPKQNNNSNEDDENPEEMQAPSLHRCERKEYKGGKESHFLKMQLRHFCLETVAWAV